MAASDAGDCATVRTREAEVREIDPKFHAAVFVHDASIKRCLVDDGTGSAGQPPAASP